MEKMVEDLLNSLKSQPENPYTAMVRANKQMLPVCASVGRVARRNRMGC